MATDVLLQDYDIIIADGDIAIGQSDYQHVETLLATHHGHWRQWPILGIGIDKYLNGPIDKTIERTIKVALEYDGAKRFQVKVTKKGIEISAGYE